MKKLITLILAIAVFLPSAVWAEEISDSAEPEQEVMSAAMRRKVDILSAADVLRGYADGSFRLEQNITRAEFAVLCVRMLGYEERVSGMEEVGATFLDTEGHWAVENIEFAKQLGLFVGSDGYFYPDNNITGYEVVKTVVCMLGYDTVADVNGGWPDGYLKVASELGLLKKIEGEYRLSEAVTRGFVVSMVFEALDTPVIGMEFEAGTIKYTNDGESLFENVYHIYSTEGRVTATEYSDLYIAEAGSKEGTVEIDGEEYLVGKTNADGMIGYFVEVYYRMEDKHSDKTIVYIAPRKNSGEITIEADSIEKMENNRLWYDENGKMRSFNLEKSLLVFYNKRAYPDYTAADFKPQNGNVKLLDGDGNGVYEAAFITEYDNIVLGNVSKDTVKLIDYFNPSRYVELEPNNADGDIIYTITRNEAACDVGKLSKLDVLSVYKSKDGCIIDIIAVNDTFDGTIRGKREKDGKNIAVTDSGEYVFGKNCDKNFAVGGSYRFYLNHMNEIAGFELQSATTRFAYIMKVAEDDYNEDTLILKILDSDGKIKQLNTSDKIKIDGSVKKDAAEIKDALRRNENYAKVDKYYNALLKSGRTESYDYAQLIMIKTNADDEITQIMTEKPYNNHLSYAQRQKNPNEQGYTEEELCDLELGYEGLYRHNLDSVGTGYDTPGIYFTTNRVLGGENYIRYTTSMNTIEGKIALTSKTKFFILCTDVDAADKYSVATGGAFTDGEQIKQGDIQVYNMNKANEAMAVVLVRGSSSTVNSSLFLVDHVEEGLNEDDEIRLVIEGLYGGENVRYICRDDAFAKDANGKNFEQGDVIRVSVTDGEITASEMLADYSDLKFSRSSPAALDTSSYYDIGKVYNIGNGNITMAMGSTADEYVNRRTYTLGGSVYIYDEERGKVYVGSADDIEDYANYKNSGATACVYLNYGKMHQLVYYKTSAK